MTTSKVLETRALLSTDTNPAMNVHVPTRLHIALFVISLSFVLERRSCDKVFPFDIGLVGGIIPPECLIWSFLICELAVRDVVELYGLVKGGHRSGDRLQESG